MYGREINQEDLVDHWNDPHIVKKDTCRAYPHEALKDGFTGIPENTLDFNPEIQSWASKHEANVLGDIVEVGCGGGRLGLVFKSNFPSCTLHLVDHAILATQVTAARFEALKLRANVICQEGKYLQKSFDLGSIDVVYTHTALQHNSWWKQDEIFPSIHSILKPGGLLFMWNERTFSSTDDLDFVLTHDYGDERGSAGTASWWIRRICPVGFELAEYFNSSFTFRKI